MLSDRSHTQKSTVYEATGEMPRTEQRLVAAWGWLEGWEKWGRGSETRFYSWGDSNVLKLRVVMAARPSKHTIEMCTLNGELYGK